jgi:hypothetical protein
MDTYDHHLMARRGWSTEVVQMRAYWLCNERQSAVRALSDDVLETLP